MRHLPLLALISGCVAAPTRVVQTTYTVEQDATMLAPTVHPSLSTPLLPLDTAGLTGGAFYTPVQSPSSRFGHVFVDAAGTVRAATRAGPWAELGLTADVGPGIAAIDTRSRARMGIPGALWRTAFDLRVPVVDEPGFQLGLVQVFDVRGVHVVRRTIETTTTWEDGVELDSGAIYGDTALRRAQAGYAVGGTVHVEIPVIHATLGAGLAAQTLPTWDASHTQVRTCTTTWGSETCEGEIDYDEPKVGLGVVSTPTIGATTALAERWSLTVQGYALLGEPARSMPVGAQVLFTQRVALQPRTPLEKMLAAEEAARPGSPDASDASERIPHEP